MVEKEPSSIDSVRRDGGIDAQAVDALGDALAVLIARQFDALVILIDRSGTLRHHGSGGHYHIGLPTRSLPPTRRRRWRETQEP